MGCCENKKEADVKLPEGSRYELIAVTQEGVEKMGYVRSLFSALEQELNTLLRSCRETSLVYTDLETACMWANKAIARAHRFVAPTPEVEQKITEEVGTVLAAEKADAPSNTETSSNVTLEETQAPAAA